MAIALGNIVTTLTQEHLMPVVVENFYQGNALFMMLRDKKKTWRGGHRMDIPTEIAGRDNVGSYAGFDAWSNAQEDVRAKFQVNASQYRATVSISGIQVATNKGKEAVVDLLTEEMASIGRALPDNIGDDIYGDGTGNNNKAITGLVAHVDDSKSYAVNKFGYMLETLARSLVLMPRMA